MKMLIPKTSLPLCVSFFLLISVSAQEKVNRFNVSYMPQYMLIFGQRMDLDIRLGQSNHWLVFGAHYYLNYAYDSKNMDYYDYEDETGYDKLQGYAFNLEHRIYLSNESLLNNIYFNYGLYYGHFNINYGEYSWGSIPYEDDLEALTYDIFDRTTHIDKLGPNIMIGYKQDFIDNFFFDFYAGAGLRYSIISPDDGSQRTYSEHLFSYGFTGTTFLVGIRIGKCF